MARIRKPYHPEYWRSHGILKKLSRLPGIHIEAMRLPQATFTPEDRDYMLTLACGPEEEDKKAFGAQILAALNLMMVKERRLRKFESQQDAERVMLVDPQGKPAKAAVS